MKPQKLKSLEKAVRAAIRRIEGGEICSITDGERFICSLCEIPEKPCIDNPAFECKEMLIGGTQLRTLQELSKDGSPVACAMCGEPLPGSQWKRNVSAEVCRRCRSRAVRRSRSDAVKGIQS